VRFCTRVTRSTRSFHPVPRLRVRATYQCRGDERANRARIAVDHPDGELVGVSIRFPH
jgi:hypothetical protein